MKYFYKRIITLTISFLLLFTSIMTVACDCSNTEQSFSGVHKNELVKTDDWLVKDGNTAFVLVTPSGVISEELKVAKQEFVYLFNKATGITIPSITDEGLTLNENSKYISLGKTSLYNSIVESNSDRVVSYDEYVTGYRIFSEGKSIFLVGGSDLGTAYSVYKFMELTFNYECYSNNCLTIDSGVKEKGLFTYTVDEIPDVKYVSTNSFGVFKDVNTYDQRMLKYRMKAAVSNNQRSFWLFRPDDTNYARAAAQGAHTSLTLIPIDYFRESHPDWFSNRSEGAQNRSQLCYTAHGKEAEYNALLSQMVDSIAHSLKRVPASQDAYQVAINIGDEDNSNHCDCKACKEIIDAYGARSALEILFLNDLIPLVDEWMNKPENAEYKRENLKFSFLVYNETEPAPVVYDEKNDKYELKNGLTIDKRITPIICMASYSDFRQSIYSETNQKQIEVLNAWKDILDGSEVAFWTYSTAFNNISYFYDSFSFYNNDLYEILAGFDTWFLYNECQGSVQGAHTSFHQLKMYLESKLAWNCSLDIEELINNYFDAMYKDVAPAMKDIFYTERAIADKAAIELSLYKTEQILTQVNMPRAYDLATLLQLLDKYEALYEQIEKYKEVDFELYNELHFHISQEWISPAVMVMDMFFEELTVDDATALLEKFKTVYQETKISKVTKGKETTENWIIVKEEELNLR